MRKYYWKFAKHFLIFDCVKKSVQCTYSYMAWLCLYIRVCWWWKGNHIHKVPFMIHKSLKRAFAIHTIQVFISFHFIWIVVLDVKFPANSFVDCAVSVPIFLVWFHASTYLWRVTAQDEKKKCPTNSKRKIKMNTKKEKRWKKNSKKNLCVCCICFIFFSLVQCNLFAAFFLLNVYHAEVKREDAIKWCI